LDPTIEASVYGRVDRKAGRKRTWPSSVLDGYAKATKVTCPGFAEVRLAMATKKASSNW
jgi:hypothetical protein